MHSLFAAQVNTFTHCYGIFMRRNKLGFYKFATKLFEKEVELSFEKREHSISNHFGWCLITFDTFFSRSPSGLFRIVQKYFACRKCSQTMRRNKLGFYKFATKLFEKEVELSFEKREHSISNHFGWCLITFDTFFSRSPSGLFRIVQKYFACRKCSQTMWEWRLWGDNSGEFRQKYSRYFQARIRQTNMDIQEHNKGLKTVYKSCNFRSIVAVMIWQTGIRTGNGRLTTCLWKKGSLWILPCVYPTHINMNKPAYQWWVCL